MPGIVVKFRRTSRIQLVDGRYVMRVQSHKIWIGYPTALLSSHATLMTCQSLCGAEVVCTLLDLFPTRGHSDSRKLPDSSSSALADR